jgi:hypothetical protein
VNIADVYDDEALKRIEQSLAKSPRRFMGESEADDIQEEAA